MKTIFVSKNFINNMINLINVSEDRIFSEIQKILIYEKFININNELCFKKIDDRFQGLVIDDHLIYFASKLNSNNKTKSRNTFIAQNFSSCFFYANNKNLKIYLTVNPFDLDKNIEAILSDSIKFDLKILSTLNVKISNKFGKIEQFFSIKNFLELKNKIRNVNKGNKSTYIKLLNSDIYIYGKCDGANLKRTFIECIAAKKMNKEKRIYFIPLNGIEKLNNNSNIKNYFQKNKIIILNDKQLYNDININFNDLINSKNDDIIKRNQQLFYKKIILKYNEFINIDECFACNYNISENLISSHIHRVTDIKREYLNKEIDKEKAIEKIISGDNGFLLCPNHDKEFEKGMIFFDYENMQFLSSSKYSYKYITENLIKKIFPIELKTAEFENNLIKHQRRISIK